MNKFQSVFPALLIASGLLVAGFAAADAPVATDSAPAVAGHGWHGHHGGHAFAHVLRQLNLTPDQQTQIKSIMAQSKPQLSTLHASMRANHEALAEAAPTDANYPTLLATEKANAAARVQAMSDLKTQIYAVLTPEQRAQIPGLLAANRAARAEKIAAWHAQH